jgi:ABC-2 type transport system permease protein
LRFFASELALVFSRPRNLALLGVVAAVPIFLGVVLRLTPHSGGGGGPEFLNQLAGNGVFLALVVLTLAQNALLLPLSIAVVAGDAIAGEANQCSSCRRSTPTCRRTSIAWARLTSADVTS